MPAVDQPTLGREGVETALSPRPVMLVTLSVRVDPVAERVAIEAALETRARLLLANLIWLPPHPTTLILAREYATLPHEEDLDEVRATAGRAAALGIPTELLRISSRRPLAALIELVREREPGLVVLGPDPRRSPRWWRALAARRIRARADCLVWIAPGTERWVVRSAPVIISVRTRLAAAGRSSQIRRVAQVSADARGVIPLRSRRSEHQPRRSQCEVQSDGARDRA